MMVDAFDRDQTLEYARVFHSPLSKRGMTLNIIKKFKFQSELTKVWFTAYLIDKCFAK